MAAQATNRAHLSKHVVDFDLFRNNGLKGAQVRNEDVKEQRRALLETREVGVTLKHLRAKNVSAVLQPSTTLSHDNNFTFSNQNKGTPMSFGFQRARRMRARAKKESWNGSYFSA
jgi:hypothetical protein